MYRINGFRLSLGFVVGTLLPPLPYALVDGWLVLGVGIVVTASATIMVMLPAFVLLRDLGILRVWIPVVLGGLLSCYFDMTLGVAYFGVFVPTGAVAGLLGWLIAFGPRVEPQSDER